MKTAELKKWYKEELERKDKIIEELRKENMILLKTALKKSSDIIMIEESKKAKRNTKQKETK